MNHSDGVTKALPADRGAVWLIGDQGASELEAMLRSADMVTALNSNLEEAEHRLSQCRPEAVVLDGPPSAHGLLAFVSHMKEIDPAIVIIVVASAEGLPRAMEVMRAGADQFLAKPVDAGLLVMILNRAFAQQKTVKRSLAEESRKVRFGIYPFYGTSAVITRLEEQVVRLLEVDRPLLIQGESGVGKSALARWIHSHSLRKGGAFVELNCAGLTKDLLETELFGHEKGAFTGAVSAKIGLMEISHRGTLFLDEIGDMDPLVQPKLLKAIEEQVYRRLGDTKDQKVDFKLIGATHQDLRSRVLDGRFREDLYYRVSGLPLLVPPLRERKEDIGPLARFFLERLAQEWRCGPLELTPAADKKLETHLWPGNIRELKNALERAIIHRRGQVLGPEDFELGRSVVPNRSEWNTNLSLEEVERLHLQKVLEELDWKVDEASSRLRISRSSLYQRIQKFGLIKT
jgi:DNA-binding NtrC family response regulator